MLDSLARKLGGNKNTDLALVGGGMVALLAGRKLTALGMFAKGLAGLERAWREAHPEFDGDLAERWQEAIRFYEETHTHPTNKVLHIVGIPMIAGGAAGLLLFPAYRPLWGISAASFATGWVLNFIGHGVYEKAAPAFADDPLSFIAGPVWDLQQLRKARGAGPSVVEDATRAAA